MIYGVLTACNPVGQIPPLQVCDQNFDAGPLWYESLMSNKDKKPDNNLKELSENYQFTYSF